MLCPSRLPVMKNAHPASVPKMPSMGRTARARAGVPRVMSASATARRVMKRSRPKGAGEEPLALGEGGLLRGKAGCTGGLAASTASSSHPARRHARPLHGARGRQVLPLGQRAADRPASPRGRRTGRGPPRAHLAVVDRDLAAREGEARQAGDLLALEDVVVDRRLLACGRDGLRALRVPDDEIGIGADQDRALSRIAC